ncbi:MAG: hypothetical protein K8S97_14840 [Anaerolineae bacterium]|nr:hypothetical protein [Anaerolineae bacterium]
MLLDIAFFTRQIAGMEENLRPVLWGYTALPSHTADELTRTRAFAALREIERFMIQAEQVPGGYPFNYAPQLDSSRTLSSVWRGTLTEQPFSLWYCFEEPDAVSQMASVIQPLLERTFLRHMLGVGVNLSAQRGEGRTSVHVGTASSRSVVLDIATFQTRWAVEQVREALAGFVAPSPSTSDPVDVAQRVWNERTVFGSLQHAICREVTLQKWQRRSLIERADEVKRWLAPEAKHQRTPLDVLAQYFKQSVRTGDMEAMDVLLNRVPQALAQFGQIDPSGVLRRPSDDVLPYGVPELHLEWLVEVLETVLIDLLNANTPNSTLSYVQAIVQHWHALVARGQDYCAELADVLPAPNQYFERYRRQEQRIRAYRARSDIGRRQLRRELQHYEKVTLQYAAILQLPLWLDACTHVLIVFEQALAKLLAQVQQWQGTLDTCSRHAVEVVAQETPATTMPLAKSVPDSLEHPWVTAQRARYLPPGQPLPLREMLQWRLGDAESGVLELVLDVPGRAQPHVLSADGALFTVLKEHAARIMERAPQEMTLLDFLLDETGDPVDPKALLDLFDEAAEVPLRRDTYEESVSYWHGWLLAYEDSHQSEQLQFLGDVLSRLRVRNFFSPNDAQAIDRRPHSDPQRLTYLHVIENIDLANEVVAYAEMAGTYQREMAGQGVIRDAARDPACEHHVLSAEIQAARLERRFNLNAPLPPQIVTMLYNPVDLLLFWVAKREGLIEGRVTGASGHQYWLRIAELDWPLTAVHVLSDDDLMLEALRAFLVGYAARDNMMPYEYPLRVKTQIQEHIDTVARQIVANLATRAPDLPQQFGLPHDLQGVKPNIQLAVGRHQFFAECVPDQELIDDKVSSPNRTQGDHLVLLEAWTFLEARDSERATIRDYGRRSTGIFDYRL